MRRMLFLITLLITGSGCKEELLHNLTEAQANQVWVSLEKHQIKVQKEKTIGGWSISVEKNETLRALQLLQDLKLPHGMWKDKAPEANSIIPSKEERQLSRERQLASSIEGSLLSLPGVSDAHVHLVIPGAESMTKPTASVLVVSSRISLQPQQLRDLVAGASGISKESVAVAIINEEEFLLRSKLKS